MLTRFAVCEASRWVRVAVFQEILYIRLQPVSPETVRNNREFDLLHQVIV